MKLGRILLSLLLLTIISTFLFTTTTEARHRRLIYISPIPTITPRISIPTITVSHSSPTPTPTIHVVSPTADNPIKDFIMNGINNYRVSKGLSAVETSATTCDFAKIRAKEITTAFNHDGFTNRVNNHTLPYPSYHLITENIAMTSNYKDVVNMWINSPGHEKNLRADTPYICVENNGNYYAMEGWKP